jgi:hypothetical protein
MRAKKRKSQLGSEDASALDVRAPVVATSYPVVD